jgi:hypothetical protein
MRKEKNTASAAFIKEYMLKSRTTISEIKGLFSCGDFQRMAPKNHFFHLRFYTKQNNALTNNLSQLTIIMLLIIFPKKIAQAIAKTF